MPDCCSPGTGTNRAKKHQCPVNGIEYAAVSEKTILHHIQRPWEWQARSESYYFCDDPKCDVVYFGDQGTIISKSQLRYPVGIKDTSDDATLCYCFGISREAHSQDPTLKDYVIQQTRLGLCSCETSNPSGRCCLKDFPQEGASEFPGQPQ